MECMNNILANTEVIYLTLTVGTECQLTGRATCTSWTSGFATWVLAGRINLVVLAFGYSRATFRKTKVWYGV